MEKRWITGIPWWQFRNEKVWMTLKVFSVLFLIFVFPVSGKVYSQQERINITVNNVSLEQLIREIKSKTTVDFLYNIQELEKNGPVSVKMKQATVEEILQNALKGKELSYALVNGVVVLRPKQYVAVPQDPEELIRGKVKDADGNPLPGVTVMLKGTTIGVVTNAKGEYAMVKPQEKEIYVMFSFIGMKKMIVPYRGEKSLDVVMEEDTYTLDVANVVHTGYQDLDRRRLTSAITSVQAKDVLIPGMTSIDQALEGRIPELRLSLNSGEVGATPRIRVRGTSSLLGNREPLWVLDGFILRDPVKVSNEELNNPDYINIVGNAIAGINPQDIERIDVLKDAAATALYGTRAANGVIVVTTKKGSVGKPRFSYNHSSSLTRRPRYSDKAVNLMNSQERVQFGKDLCDLHYRFPWSMAMVGYEGAMYRYYTGQTTFEEFENEVERYEKANTDWFDLLTQDTYSQDHTLNVSGGSEDVRFYASVGYNRSNGVSKSTYTERYTSRLSLNVNFTEKLKMDFNLNLSVQKKNHLMDGIDAMNYAYNTTRALPCYNDDGSLFYYKRTSKVRSQEQFRYNILNEIENSSNTYDGNSLGANINLRYQTLKGLTFGLGASYNRSNTDQEKWWGENTWHVACLKNGELEDIPRKGNEGYSYLPYGGILNTTHSRGENYTLRTQIDYHKRFGEDEIHIVNTTFGFEMNGSNSRSVNDENRGFLKNRGLQFVGVDHLEDYPHWRDWLKENHRTIGQGLSHEISGYLTLSYSFKNHFTLNANGRFDASNKFGSRSNEKFLPIWSVSGMWNVKENMLKATEIFSEMRLRASYGVQGNMLEDQSPNLIIRNETINTNFNENVSTIARYPNPNLRWEQTKHLDVGLDVSLFDSRLSLNASLYWKRTSDCFTHVKVSSVNGLPGDTYVMNGGEVTNSGYSFGITGSPVKTEDFQWSVSTYYDGNINKVKSGSVESYTLQDYLNGTALVDGESISSFWSYKFTGLNPENGTPMFDDYHERQHLLQYKSLEETVLMAMERSGQRDPIFSGSLSNTFTYKGLSLGLHFSYSLGAKMRLFSLYNPVIAGISAESNVRKEFLDRWRVTGDERRTDIPVIMSPADPEFNAYSSHFSTNAPHIKKFASSTWGMYDQSDLRVVSANYLKCTSMSLRYSFNDKLLRKTPFSTLSVSLNALNLFLITSKEMKGQDPSQPGFDKPNLSVRPSYTLQFNVSF